MTASPAQYHYDPERDVRPLAELLSSVMRVHGPVQLELRDLPPAFQALREDLEAGRDPGRSLVGLRRLTGGYDTRRALCRTHRRLLEGLEALDARLAGREVST